MQAQFLYDFHRSNLKGTKCAIVQKKKKGMHFKIMQYFASIIFGHQTYREFHTGPATRVSTSSKERYGPVTKMVVSG